MIFAVSGLTLVLFWKTPCVFFGPHNFANACGTRVAGLRGISLPILQQRLVHPMPFTGPVDRIFTMITGNGLELKFADGHRLFVDRPLVPHRFGCDDTIDCFLHDGPCTALNLFTVRDLCKAQASIRRFWGVETSGNPRTTTLIYSLEGTLALASEGVGGLLHRGEVAVLKASFTSAASSDVLLAWVGEVRAA